MIPSPGETAVSLSARWGVSTRCRLRCPLLQPACASLSRNTQPPHKREHPAPLCRLLVYDPQCIIGQGLEANGRRAWLPTHFAVRTVLYSRSVLEKAGARLVLVGLLHCCTAASIFFLKQRRQRLSGGPSVTSCLPGLSPAMTQHLWLHQALDQQSHGLGMEPGRHHPHCQVPYHFHPHQPGEPVPVVPCGGPIRRLNDLT